MLRVIYVPTYTNNCIRYEKAMTAHWSGRGEFKTVASIHSYIHMYVYAHIVNTIKGLYIQIYEYICGISNVK